VNDLQQNVHELCAKVERKIKRLDGQVRKCLSAGTAIAASEKQEAELLRSRVRELDRLLDAVRTDESFHFGRANRRAAIFMYKRDPTIADVWPIVERMDRRQNVRSRGGRSTTRMHVIRFELHRSRQRFLEGLEKWNRSVGPRNSYLKEATRRGYDVRIGFEDTLRLRILFRSNPFFPLAQN
jgi:hypothetical protein